MIHSKVLLCICHTVASRQCVSAIRNDGYCHPQTKLREANVFIGVFLSVSHSVHWGGVRGRG